MNRLLIKVNNCRFFSYFRCCYKKYDYLCIRN